MCFEVKALIFRWLCDFVVVEEARNDGAFE